MRKTMWQIPPLLAHSVLIFFFVTSNKALAHSTLLHSTLLHNSKLINQPPKNTFEITILSADEKASLLQFVDKTPIKLSAREKKRRARLAKFSRYFRRNIPLYRAYYRKPADIIGKGVPSYVFSSILNFDAKDPDPNYWRDVTGGAIIALSVQYMFEANGYDASLINIEPYINCYSVGLSASYKW